MLQSSYDEKKNEKKIDLNLFRQKTMFQKRFMKQWVLLLQINIVNDIHISVTMEAKSLLIK